MLDDQARLVSLAPKHDPRASCRRCTTWPLSGICSARSAATHSQVGKNHSYLCFDRLAAQREQTPSCFRPVRSLARWLRFAPSVFLPVPLREPGQLASAGSLAPRACRCTGKLRGCHRPPARKFDLPFYPRRHAWANSHHLIARTTLLLQHSSPSRRPLRRSGVPNILGRRLIRFTGASPGSSPHDELIYPAQSRKDPLSRPRGTHRRPETSPSFRAL